MAVKRGITLLFILGIVGLLVVIWRSTGGERRGAREPATTGSSPARPVDAKETPQLAPAGEAEESARSPERVMVEKPAVADAPRESEPAAPSAKKIAHVRGR